MKKLELSIVALYALMPMAIMGSTEAPIWIFYALLAICLTLLCRQNPDLTRQTLGRYKALLLCYCVPTLAVLASSLAHRHWADMDFARVLPLSLGLPILLLALPHCKHIKLATLRHYIWGVYIAAVGATIYIVSVLPPRLHRPYTEIYNVVSYSNLLLLLAVLSLFSLRWQLTRWPQHERTLKILVTAVAVIGVILTQTRTSWLAIPAFALITVALATQFRHPWRSLGLLIGVLILALALAISSSRLRGRLHIGYDQLWSCLQQHDNANNNVCARIQLWRAAGQIFQENPVFGLGDGRKFAPKLKNEALPEGIVSPQVARNLVEPHNDFLYSLSSFGILGGLGLLLTYFAPAWIFVQRLRARHSPPVRTAAAMGLAVSLGFVFLGLTEFMFHYPRTAAYYVMFIALFLAMSDEGQT
ncbi:MAG TPA: O-antigen ligase family protein [Eoetvoesiella sp.]